MRPDDDFGNRMKAYEAVETARRLDVHLPIYARIDGRAFSSFTRGMRKPFDERMLNAMINTTRHLVGATHARIGYTQSDEISLVWLADRPESDIFFSGKIQKMVSILASMAAAKFVTVCPEEFRNRLPHFDCRVLQLPSTIEAANAFLWRAMDARKNAISAVAQVHFSPRQLHGKDQKAMLAMLAEIGVDFESFPAAFKQGTFLRRKTSLRCLTDVEMEKIPVAHRPVGPVERSSVVSIDLPPFNKVTDREEVIFG